MAQALRINWRRGGWVLLRVLMLSAAVMIGGLAYLAWQSAYHFTHVGCIGERASLATLGYPAEPIEIETPRGYRLRGWFSIGERYPDIAIVVLAGASGNTQFALEDARLLAQAGYSTLIYEHRACADPTLLHSGGYLEADDVASAVAYLQTRSELRHIGGLGFSAGGTAALLAAAKTPAIEAVIAAGGFSSLEADVLHQSQQGGPLAWVFGRLVLISLGLQLGVAAEEVSPVSHIAQISPRPVLLIYGQGEAWHGAALYAAAGEPKQLWLVPGVGHGGYQAAYPAEYQTRVVGFFESVFGRKP